MYVTNERPTNLMIIKPILGHSFFCCQLDVKCGGDVQQLICPIVWTEIQSKQTKQETAVPYLNTKRLIVCRQIHILTYTLAHKR